MQPASGDVSRPVGGQEGLPRRAAGSKVGKLDVTAVASIQFKSALTKLEKKMKALLAKDIEQVEIAALKQIAEKIKFLMEKNKKGENPIDLDYLVEEDSRIVELLQNYYEFHCPPDKGKEAIQIIEGQIHEIMDILPGMRPRPQKAPEKAEEERKSVVAEKPKQGDVAWQGKMDELNGLLNKYVFSLSRREVPREGLVEEIRKIHKELMRFKRVPEVSKDLHTMFEDKMKVDDICNVLGVYREGYEDLRFKELVDYMRLAEERGVTEEDYPLMRRLLELGEKRKDKTAELAMFLKSVEVMASEFKDEYDQQRFPTQQLKRRERT